MYVQSMAICWNHPCGFIIATGDSASEDEADGAASEQEVEKDDMENNDGVQMPADLQRLDFEDGAPDESSDLSDDDMEEYMGDDDLGTGDEAEEAQAPGPLTAGVGEAGEKPLASAPVSHSGRPKQYHLSPEWLQLAEAGQHLLRLPPVAGCGVNRHPSGSFWISGAAQSNCELERWRFTFEVPDALPATCHQTIFGDKARRCRCLACTTAWFVQIWLILLDQYQTPIS